ncbi:MAG: zinc-ribbon domain-containing protein [Bacteroidaceae bacterium]|nr:zinc-ribbon domain-containing protein [Bacteroidaceae bacterium]
MKFCPYCGKEMWDENAAFCAECGKQIPSRSQKEATPETVEEVEAVNDAGETTAADNIPEEIPCEEKPVQGDGYDGYYDDVIPDDYGHLRSNVDKELIKKIIVLGISVALIIGACVAIMYIL